jgi:hypothetical protein
VRFPVPKVFTILSVLCAGTLSPGRGSAADAVSFSREIAPVLQSKCVACHGPDEQKGGYRLDSFERLLQPGDSGDAPITGGDPEQSLLYALTVTDDEDDRMPQKDDPLPPEFLTLFKRWLAEGAVFDGGDRTRSLVELIPPAAHPAPPQSYPHALPVLSLARLPDGQRFAIGGYHEVLIRELKSGELRQRLTNLPERIHALLPLGRRLLYAGGNPGRAGEVGVRELDSSAAAPSPQVLARAADTFLTLALSPDGAHLAAGGADKSIRIIELATGRELRQLTQHADWVLGLAFSPDGSRLASASRDGTARIFDPATGEMLSAFREHDSPVFAVAFLGDGRQAASAGRDGRVRFWRVDRAEQVASLADLGGEVFKLLGVGDNLLAAGAAGDVREIIVADRKVGQRWKSPRSGAVLALTVDDASGRLIAGLDSGEVVIWPAQAGEPVRSSEPWPRATELR